MDKKITLEQLNAYEAAFDGERANQVAMRAVTSCGVVKAAQLEPWDPMGSLA